MKQLLPFLLSALLLLTGCGAPMDEIPDTSWEDYQLGLEETPEPPSPDYPSAFSLAYHKDLTLDPITCGDGIQQDVAALLYEPLFQLDEGFEPTPLLCDSYSWDESGLVCTLNIRQDVLFSDGSALTAADAAASLRRAMASQRYSYRLRQVVAVTSNRSGQVVLTLSAPNRGLPALLDIPIVKSGTEGQMVPTGTGPYVLVTGSDGNRLLANADWWRQMPLPVSSIPLVHAKDQDTAVYLFSSRRVELLTVDPTGDQISVTGQSAEAELPTTLFQFIGFNAAKGLFSDPSLRAICGRALQRELLCGAFLSGHAQPAQFPISPLSPLYPGDLEQRYSYDETLSALKTAGQDTGEVKPLTLLVNEEDSFRLANAKFIAESLSLLDWQVSVRALPWEEYMLALESGDFDLYYGEARLTADWNLTDLIGTGGALNYGGYTNGLTDALLLSFAGAVDRETVARQLCLHLQSAVPIAPICFKNYTVLTHPGVVEGLSPAGGSTFYGLENWRVHLDGET